MYTDRADMLDWIINASGELKEDVIITNFLLYTTKGHGYFNSVSRAQIMRYGEAPAKRGDALEHHTL